MSDQEFQLAVIAIVFGSAIAITIVVVLGTLINSAIKRRSKSSLTDNEDFLEALRQFKKKTDRRLSNLETIVIDEEPNPDYKKAVNPPEDHQKIEFSDQKGKKEAPNDPKNKTEENKSGGNLKNMLKE